MSELNNYKGVENLRKTLERVEREKKEKELKFYLDNIGVKLNSFPLIYLN